MSEPHAGEPAIRVSDAVMEDTAEHRRRTTRQVRHSARTKLHALAGDEEALEDADLLCPEVPHDLGRKASPRAKDDPRPGRRPGFKVWKTPFWKRRRSMRSARNVAARRLAEMD